MAITAVSSKIVLDGFKAIVESGAEKFCSEYETPKNSTESKTEYSYTYGCLSVAAFTCSAIFSRHLNFYKNYIMVAFFIVGAASLYLVKQVKQVPTQECLDLRKKFAEFSTPLIEALERAKINKIDALRRAICGPQENPTKYVTLNELDSEVNNYIARYDMAYKDSYDSNKRNNNFHHAWKSDSTIETQVVNYQDALEHVKEYLSSGFQEKISENLDSEVQKGVAKLKRAATCFVYGYDKPWNENPANTKPYVKATWNVASGARVEAWN